MNGVHVVRRVMEEVKRKLEAALDLESALAIFKKNVFAMNSHATAVT